jgi:TonB family protein
MQPCAYLVARRLWLAGGSLLAVSLLLAACGSADAPDTASLAAPYATAAYNPEQIRQISDDAAWLGTNKLPARLAKDAAPKPTASCPEDRIKDRGPRQFRIPATLATVLVSYSARPWAFVRYDLDAEGKPMNLKVERSAGLKSFDGAALDTVAGWRFEMGGLAGATGCVSEVSVT